MAFRFSSLLNAHQICTLPDSSRFSSISIVHQTFPITFHTVEQFLLLFSNLVECSFMECVSNINIWVIAQIATRINSHYYPYLVCLFLCVCNLAIIIPILFNRSQADLIHLNQIQFKSIQLKQEMVFDFYIPKISQWQTNLNWFECNGGSECIDCIDALCYLWDFTKNNDKCK